MERENIERNMELVQEWHDYIMKLMDKDPDKLTKAEIRDLDAAERWAWEDEKYDLTHQ